MELLKHKKLNHLMAELNRKKPLLATNVTQELQMTLTVPAVVLAKQLTEFAPDLLKQKKVKVIVAGAAFNEAMNKSRCYYLLNTLLNTNIEWEIYLIGNEVAEVPPLHVIDVTKHYKNEPVTVHVRPLMLEEALAEIGKPDLLVLNHPGFESHYEDWFLSDDGIDKCLLAGVPIVGCSYGTDEIQIDSFYVDAFGLELKDKVNALYLDMSREPPRGIEVPQSIVEGANSGMMDWGRTIWSMTARGERVDQDGEKLGFIADMNTVRSSINMYLMASGTITMPYECYEQYVRWHDKRRIMRVYGQYSFDMTGGFIFDEETQQVMNNDVELDTTDFDMANLSIHDKLVMMTTVYQEYIAEFAEEGSEEGIELDEEMFEALGEMFGGSEVLKKMLDGDSGDGMQGIDINEMFGFQGNKELTEREEKIAELAHNKDVNALKDYSSDVLKDFTDETHKNLVHIAAEYDSVDLLKFAIESGVSLKEVDGDSYGVLDICSESPVSMSVLTYLLSNNLVPDLINRQDPRGFTAIHRAADSGSQEAFDLLKSHGADPSIAAISGLSASDVAKYAFSIQ
ncbi:ankyrin repeat domain-containing protein [Vibrio barjaei]|uniref:ankyrin repeat domain-containing protein n=1 Tax=Vibrio barjaei TaxID=1676683 RepID=UPI0022845910|nr:ankyrin repeat domain-containing protein [Vibrio barjaei]MCY9870453.1 ankyrin repeat domain-containing protein [Vibrio barjaei]